MIVEPNIGIIFAEMANSSFKSSKLCEQLKECGKNQSPIVTTLGADDFNRTFEESEMDRGVQSIDLITPLLQTHADVAFIFLSFFFF
uniref:Uncharacterized protein n=1 Tax=Parascaris equorum TaxID=6256 RepID=A0A914RWL1_PAREQ